MVGRIIASGKWFFLNGKIANTVIIKLQIYFSPNLSQTKHYQEKSNTVKLVLDIYNNLLLNTRIIYDPKPQIVHAVASSNFSPISYYNNNHP